MFLLESLAFRVLGQWSDHCTTINFGRLLHPYGLNVHEFVNAMDSEFSSVP